MNNLNDTLPDLLRRATENLEPESTDLGERGRLRGLALRRRRRILTAAGAVLATAGVAVGGNHFIRGGSAGEAPVAGTPPLAASAKTTAATPSTPAATPKETLQTLKSLLPTDLRVSRPQMWGDNFIAVSFVVDDGKGASHIEASVQTVKFDMTCADQASPSCRVRPDGSIYIASQTNLTRSNTPGVILNSVTIYRPGRKVVHVSNANTGASTPEMNKARPTRSQPVFSIAELTRMADSSSWKIPPASYGKEVGR